MLPSDEVAGDGFDVVENVDSAWISLARGLGDPAPAVAGAAVALGAPRPSRRGDASITETTLAMHRALREMPGRRRAMPALLARWERTWSALAISNCGHVAPVILRADGDVERLGAPARRGSEDGPGLDPSSASARSSRVTAC